MLEDTLPSAISFDSKELSRLIAFLQSIIRSNMRVYEEVMGKIIVDAMGNEIGKVDDVEIDLESKRVEAIIVKGKGMLLKQFQAEKLASLMKRLRISKTEDLLIPFDEVQAIGKYVVLKSTIDATSTPPATD